MLTPPPARGGGGWSSAQLRTMPCCRQEQRKRWREEGCQEPCRHDMTCATSPTTPTTGTRRAGCVVNACMHACAATHSGPFLQHGTMHQRQAPHCWRWRHAGQHAAPATSPTCMRHAATTHTPQASACTPHTATAAVPRSIRAGCWCMVPLATQRNGHSASAVARAAANWHACRVPPRWRASRQSPHTAGGTVRHSCLARNIPCMHHSPRSLAGKQRHTLLFSVPMCTHCFACTPAHSLHGVGTARLHLAAGLAAPDANGHALHRVLQAVSDNGGSVLTPGLTALLRGRPEGSAGCWACCTPAPNCCR